MFDLAESKWRETAKINQARRMAACAVDQVKAVVSGGNLWNRLNWDHVFFKCNESYDVFSDNWFRIPNFNKKIGVTVWLR